MRILNSSISHVLCNVYIYTQKHWIFILFLSDKDLILFLSNEEIVSLDTVNIHRGSSTPTNEELGVTVLEDHVIPFIFWLGLVSWF